MDLFTTEKEVISIVNAKVSKHSLNITLNASLACSIVIQIKSSSGVLESKFLVNRDFPSYFEEEVKSIENVEQGIVLVCYRPDVQKKRILMSGSTNVKLTLEYISSPLKPPETSQETIEDKNPKPAESGSSNVGYAFLGGFIFLLAVAGIIFFALKFKNKFSSSSSRNGNNRESKMASSAQILNEDTSEISQISNPYKIYQK